MHDRNPTPRRLYPWLAACAAVLLLALPAHAEETGEGREGAPAPALKSSGGLFSGWLKGLSPRPPAASGDGISAPDDALVVHEIPASGVAAREIDLTSPTSDIWLRIRQGFAMPDLNDDLVLYYQNWYQNRPDALRRMVERSRPYLFHIVEEIEARGMPTELALLPMVESSFNPLAYSRAHAAGLWQFIPATGKRFNLEQNWWQDQRRDIVASTAAALDYLQNIYDMNGDWHLALASYNWGEGAVKRAMEKNMARGQLTDYASLAMPTETRHYVPKLQALKNIFGNPLLVARLKLPQIPNKPYFATVELGQAVDIKTAARLANMPVHEFLALNPSHNRPLIKPDTPLVIPSDRVEQFHNNLESHNEPLATWQPYTLKPGERLDKLAPRVGMKLGDLMRLNGLQAKSKLSTGTTLLVPNGNAAGEIADLPNVAPPTAPEPEPTSKAGNGRKTETAAASKNPNGKKDGKHGGKADSGHDKSGKTHGKSHDQGRDKTGKAATQSKSTAGGGKLAGTPAKGKAADGKVVSKAASKGKGDAKSGGHEHKKGR